MPNQSRNRDRFADQMPEHANTLEDEPICILKVQLNDGYNGVEALKVYRKDVPEDVVENFAIMHNLSEKAKNNLLENVYDQLNEESNVSGTLGGTGRDRGRPPFEERKKVDLQVLRRNIDQIWQQFDLDRNGTLDKREARAFIKTALGSMRLRGQTVQEFCQDVFYKIDKDHSGSITKYEMTLFLKQILEAS